MRSYSNALKAGVLGLSMLAAAPTFLMMAEPTKAGDAQATVPGTHVTVSSVQSADFVKLSQNKILLVVSPDFSKMALKLFEKRNIPNSQIVVAEDVPSKKGMIYVNGELFQFKDLLGDNKTVDVFESKEISTVLHYLGTHMQERQKAELDINQPG